MFFTLYYSLNKWYDRLTTARHFECISTTFLQCHLSHSMYQSLHEHVLWFFFIQVCCFGRSSQEVAVVSSIALLILHLGKAHLLEATHTWLEFLYNWVLTWVYIYICAFMFVSNNWYKNVLTALLMFNCICSQWFLFNDIYDTQVQQHAYINQDGRDVVEEDEVKEEVVKYEVEGKQEEE